MGSPKGCEPYGDRVPVVVAGVTTCQGGREGRPQGEGAQVIGYYNREVCEIAERRNGTGCPPRPWQERPAVQRTVPTDVQPRPVPAGLREDLRQPGRHDPRDQRRDRGRHVRGQDRPDHRGDAARTVSLQPGPTDLHPEEERESCARWGCRRGRTSSSARWSACCWRRTTSRRSPTIRTGSGPAGDATPLCGKWSEPGPGPRG